MQYAEYSVFIWLRPMAAAFDEKLSRFLEVLTSLTDKTDALKVGRVADVGLVLCSVNPRGWHYCHVQLW